MPNWVYNSLTIEGDPALIAKVKAQLNTPFQREHDNWNMETGQMEMKTYHFSNPVFAFWNIIKPTNLEAYNKQADHSLPMEEQLMFKGENWYDWNVRNWGTKWDVAVSDDEQYPETELIEESETSLTYSFNTAWSPPVEALAELSAQYPNLVMNHSYEEETGWGGEAIIQDGSYEETETYENKCRDCDSINTMEYCENDCGEICNECHYMGESDMDAVKECEIHREFATTD